jgi:hypothetical protein
MIHEFALLLDPEPTDAELGALCAGAPAYAGIGCISCLVVA